MRSQALPKNIYIKNTELSALIGNSRLNLQTHSFTVTRKQVESLVTQKGFWLLQFPVEFQVDKKEQLEATTIFLFPTASLVPDSNRLDKPS